MFRFLNSSLFIKIVFLSKLTSLYLYGSWPRKLYSTFYIIIGWDTLFLVTNIFDFIANFWYLKLTLAYVGIAIFLNRLIDLTRNDSRNGKMIKYSSTFLTKDNKFSSKNCPYYFSRHLEKTSKLFLKIIFWQN